MVLQLFLTYGLHFAHYHEINIHVIYFEKMFMPNHIKMYGDLKESHFHVTCEIHSTKAVCHSISHE